MLVSADQGEINDAISTRALVDSGNIPVRGLGFLAKLSFDDRHGAA
jgi:hypothetical protein